MIRQMIYGLKSQDQIINKLSYKKIMSYDKILACGTDKSFDDFDFDWSVYLNDERKVYYGVNFVFSPTQIYEINPRDLDDAVLVPYVGAEDQPNKSRLMQLNDWQHFRSQDETSEHGFFFTHRPVEELDIEIEPADGWTGSVICDDRKFRFAYAIATRVREDGMVQVSLCGFASEK